MRVKDLIEMLEECNPQATVIILSQPSYPFENKLQGMTVRNKSNETSQGGESAFSGSPSDESKADDVILCMGSQLRYGEPAHFDAAENEVY